ncbi:hypothetical protein CCR86_17570 [Afifella marina]|uniref:Uncharacterized protein n=1 Tax=Afifella marina DSM 2698 TaxID=1120955 RepID=A0A1G5N4K1_AFIMA|nr:hypothetical protein [Afifella marina]MBK5919251.1 hypothetical protein [Afifella marina]RAI21292.1 hypothetical protein CH311_07400 [Afifella marina DSM 2698]SCZ32316.1 hypothetical protein SAMN03080610_01507 [Afifella marina DSM 2698]
MRPRVRTKFAAPMRGFDVGGARRPHWYLLLLDAAVKKPAVLTLWNAIRMRSPTKHCDISFSRAPSGAALSLTLLSLDLLLRRP